MFFVFDTIFDQYKTQKIFDKVVSLYILSLIVIALINTKLK